MRASFTIGNTDDRKSLIKGKYKILHENSSETTYEVSDFLQGKFSQYKDIEDICYYTVWILDGSLVAKMYLDDHLFEKALNAQKLLSKEGIGCDIVDIWRNEGENLIVSKYGGRSLAEYDLNYDCSFTHVPDDIMLKISSITEKMRILGVYLLDYHPGNFVQDEDGCVRVIDYESVDPI